jgi:hypothetical protein
MNHSVPRPLVAHGRAPFRSKAAIVLSIALLLAGCNSSDSDGLNESPKSATTVKYDFFHLPLPEIPLPNDIATVFDDSSPTKRRVNASMIAPTRFERAVRTHLDQLDGWGIFQPISIPFTGPLDTDSIKARHSDPNYDTSDDALYLVDIDRASPEFGKIHPLDLGNGNYPVALEERDRYLDNDTRGDNVSLVFEEVDEDTNGNGVLDPLEDTDADGVLDKPNYAVGDNPARDDIPARVDSLLTFYERETNTLIARPLVPLRERTTYAIVVTRRILDLDGQPVGSPFPGINHTAQTRALQPLREVLPPGLTLDDVAFAFSFTTQTVGSDWVAVRDGLYGHGVQAHLGRDFPPDFDELLPQRDAARFPNATALHILYGEDWLRIARALAPTFLGVDLNTEEYRVLAESFEYVDYYIIARYESPQLFPRVDAQGSALPLYEQAWPPDLSLKPAAARSETVYVTIAVPRKEVSARGQGGPAPAVLLGHGYTGPRFTAMQFAGYFARHGLATLCIDAPSHGIGLAPDQEALARLLLGQMGFSALADSTLVDRAFDQNGDGVKDSGADFWTAYLFHTRDIVRQYMLDWSQLIRTMRSWDGEKKWSFDLGNDSVPDVAGDFDGDGAVDIGGDAPITMAGASLGGIISMIMGGAEPEISTVVPISGGGGYSDMGMRTLQGGAVEAFILRVLSPLYVGRIDPANGRMPIQTIVIDLNDDVRRNLGSVEGVQPGDTMVVENLVNGVHGCGLVTPDGAVRASLESDRGDAIRVVFYVGPVLVPGTECQVQPGAVVRGTIERFASDVVYQAQTFAAGSPLVALDDGLGQPRATPDLRRLMSLGQLVLDPGDPASYASHLLLEPLTFPGTGQQTGAHVVKLTTQGDMNVPAGSGVTWGRAAGLIGYLDDDPRYGVPSNQVLLDTYTAEAVDNLKRFTDASGRGVHIDVENFSGGDDINGPTYPRLDPPLQLHGPDALGGQSAAFFPLSRTTGQHGFDFPGQQIDDFREACRRDCPQGQTGDPCGCNQQRTFDIGLFLFNMLGRYLASDGHDINLDLCNSRDDCPDLLPPPPARNTGELP